MRGTSLRRLLVSACVAVTASCGCGDAAVRSVTDSSAAAIGPDHVDSARTPTEHLARFRRAAGSPVDTLRHAAPTLHGLVRAWAAALSARDTTALLDLAFDRAEFAWLFYPDSPMSKPPYEMPPGLLWSQMAGNSDEGLQKVLELLGGKSLAVTAVKCPALPPREGRNLLRQGCVVSLKVGNDSLAAERYFGSIVERDGRFKFLSHANRL